MPRLADSLLGTKKYLPADRGRLAAEQVTQPMAPVLGWDRAAIHREITHYRARLVAGRAAQSMLDDTVSDSARPPVRDLRLSAE